MNKDTITVSRSCSLAQSKKKIVKALHHILLFIIFLLIFACEGEQIIEEPSSAKIEDFPLEMQQFITSFSKYKKAWDAQDNNYEAWPLGQLWYDESNKKVCQVYSSRDKHIDLQHGKVFFRNKDEKGRWSTSKLVATWESDKHSKRCHGAGICSNGDYLALVIHEDFDISTGNVYIYRSKDKGETWENEGAILIDGDKVYVSESANLFKTSSRRLLSYASVGLGKDRACVIYSDDNGYHWKKVMMPDGMGALEGSFVEISKGNIYCIARGRDEFCYPNSPQMAHSLDNGSTWVYDGDTGVCSTDAPVSQIKVDNYIYMLYGERWSYQRGYLTLRFNWLTVNDYKMMKFRPHEYILSEIYCHYGDFSYPALVETPNTIQGTFYSRVGSQVSIFEMIADKPVL